MPVIAQIIDDQHAEIMRRWKVRASTAASAKGLSAPSLQNVMGEYLSALSDEARGAGAARRKLLESHLASRLRQGYHLAEIVEEIQALGTCIAEVCGALPLAQRPDAALLAPVLAVLQRAVTNASEIFRQHLQDDEQAEKRLLLRLQTLATGSRQDRGPSGDFTAHLGDALALISQDLPAACLSVALADAALSVAASVGDAAEPCGASPRAGLLEVLNAAENGRDGSAVERTISSGERVVAVRLPEHGPLVGVLYAIRAREPFLAREVRLLESIGARLGVLLENSRLYAALRLRVEESDEEKRLRETFVAILAHDLRGPLGLSRLAASTLARDPDDPGKRRLLLTRIVSGIDRVDRMITDLLDANRVRAGQPLAVAVAPCDLAVIAREVAAEIAGSEGRQIEIGGDAAVVGIWGEQHLLRIVANLVTNAIKYGAPDAPVRLTVRAMERDAILSVHNLGNPIPAAELSRLFEPFSRAAHAQRSGVAGWGLGLALVKGSVEAHGGAVRVESSPEAGTTFTVSLPRDSRPFQHHATGA